MANDSNNALQGLLRAGFSYGSQFAEDKIFGSKPADNTALQAEKVQRGQINGSGPINARASLLAPSTWTEFFFGSGKGAASDGSLVAPAPNPLKTIVLAVVAGLIVWWLVKKFH